MEIFSRRLRTVILLTLATSGVACGRAGSAPEGDASPADRADARFAETWVTTGDSLRLYARVVGHGPDTVVIPASAWLARDVAPLARGRTLIFYDPRGRGASHYVRDTTHMGIEWEIRDLESVRAHFGLRRMSLVGWSYLGAIVALYAAEYPDHVRRIVQVGPMPPRSETAGTNDQRGSPPDSADLAYLASLRRTGLPDTDPPAYCRAYLRLVMIRPMMGRPEAAARARIDPCAHWNEWPQQLGRTVRHLIPEEWDFTDRASRIAAPVLTVHGTDDPNAPVEGGREWISSIPDARLLELEGVGHAPWLEAPETFFREVDAFLAGP